MTTAAQAFAERIPGLREVSPGLWESDDATTVSYPAGGHASLAAIESDSYWFNHRNALIAAAVARHPPGGLIVDIGGGNGYVSLGLGQAGFGSIVVEPGQAGAACARDRGLPVIRAPFETLDLPAGAIDAAGMFDVLEHIEDDAAAIQSLHAAMAPGAMLYVTVPTFGWLWSTEDVYAGHHRRYSIGSLSRLLARCGFSVPYATYFFAMLVPPIVAARAIPSRLGLTSAARPAAAAGDHRLPGGIAGTILARCMRWERDRIAGGGTIPSGSSCLAIARRR